MGDGKMNNKKVSIKRFKIVQIVFLSKGLRV